MVDTNGATEVSNTSEVEEEIETLLAKGEESFISGDLLTASRLFLEALEGDKKNTRAWNNAGVVMFAMGDDDGALQAFRAALAASPEDIDALGNMAQVYWSQGKAEEAVVKLRNALEHKPDDINSQQLLQTMGVQAPFSPKALFLDWKRASGTKGWLVREALKHNGLQIREIPQDAVRLMSASRGTLDNEGLTWLLQAASPSVLVIEASMDESDALRTMAAEQGISVVLLAGDEDIKAGKSEIVFDDGEDAEAAVTALSEHLASLQLKVMERDAEVTPLISVLTVCRDSEEDLMALLDRLALQDVDPGIFEVVVVDDASDKPLADALAEWEPPYPFHIVRNEEAEGPIRSRMIARCNAQGRWVTLYNDTDLPDRDSLRRFMMHQARILAPAEG